MTILKTENIINCRDLGGYKTGADTTAPLKAFRCGMPRNPTENDIALLKSYNIKNIIDLRGIKEAEEQPTSLKDNGNFNYYHFSTLEANPALNDVRLPIWKMYAMSLEGFGENYAEIVRTILSFNEPFLYHCFLGKDRTGILTALLLEAIGVSRKDIIADYTLSWDFIGPFVENEERNNTGLIWKQDISRLQSKEEYIISTFDYLDSTYNGAVGYLKYTGLTDKETNALRDKLIK